MYMTLETKVKTLYIEIVNVYINLCKDGIIKKDELSNETK